MLRVAVAISFFNLFFKDAKNEILKIMADTISEPRNEKKESFPVVGMLNFEFKWNYWYI